MQEIQVNFTIATGDDPDVKMASTNCHNSHVLLRNHELDKTGQAERDELAQVRSDLTMYENLIAFTKHLMNSQALVGPPDSWGRVTLLSPKPSPPPPPPPVAELIDAWTPRHPPAPPETVSAQSLIQRYEGNILDLEAREDELVLKLDECFVKDRAEGTVCGLNSNEAPDPWMAIDGVKCRGYDTRSTRELDYCGYWKSDVNPMAADKKLRQELLSVGPFCMSYSDEPVLDDENRDVITGLAPPLLDRAGDIVYVQVVAYCSPNATRTQRSGVTDVEYMIRPDREYWPVCFDSNPTHAHARVPPPHRPCPIAPMRSEFKFARQRLAAEAGDDIELCRSNLTARVEKCHINCDACSAWCTSKTVREIASVAKCSVALPVLGMLQAQHSSDLGLVRNHPTQTSQRAPRSIAAATPPLYTPGHRLPLGRQALRHAARQPERQLERKVPHPRAEQRQRTLRAAQLLELPVQFAHRPAARAPTRARARAHRPPRPDARCAGSRTASRTSAPSTRRSTRRATPWSARASTCRATPTSTASAAAELIPSRACTTCARPTRSCTRRRA